MSTGVKTEIILIRHGRPRSADNIRCTASGYANWIRKYNAADLDPRSKPAKLLSLNNYFVMSSDLHRARLTARYYCGHGACEYSSLFREMDIPYYRLPFRLRAWTWVYFSRALWMAGAGGRFESYKDAKARAEMAVNLLEVRAKTHKKIVMFGHGMMNREIRKRLQQRGWTVAEKDNGYWGVNRLHLNG